MSTQATDLLDHIRIVMVNPTLPANIGAALRAMKTMGLKHLVLVEPKHYTHPDIDALSAGASDLIAHIRVVERIGRIVMWCLGRALAVAPFLGRFWTSALLA